MDHGSVNKQLEANRALLAKRKKGMLSFVSSVNEKWVDSKRPTSEELIKIGTRIRKEEKARHIKFIIVTIIALLIIYLIVTSINWNHWFFESFKS